MKILGALLLAFPLLAQVNLNFAEGEPGGIPKAWEVAKSVPGAGPTAHLRVEGCRSAGCVLVDRFLFQKFPAAKYRGSTVVLHGDIRREGGDANGGAQLYVRTDGPRGLRMSSSEEETPRAQWVRAEVVAEVGPDADFISIGLGTFGNSQALLDNLSYEVVPAPAPDAAVPTALQQVYASIDDAYERGAFDAIAPLMRAGYSPSTLPMQSRVSGIRKLQTDGARLHARSSVQRVRAISESYALVESRTELTRYSGQRSYAYTIDYLDLWTHAPEGWRVRDAPPLAVTAADRSPQPPQPAASEPALFAIPQVIQTAPCHLATFPGVNLGFTDYRNHLVASGPISAVMIFVDFPDAPHSENTEELYQLLGPESSRWIDEVSYGKASLKINPIHQWYRMPKRSTDYHWHKPTQEGYRSYIEDAIHGVTADFGQYDIVYIVAARNSDIHNSPSVQKPAGSGIPAQKGEVQRVLMLGNDTRHALANYGAHVLLHGTGNLFGLPDLYRYNSQAAARDVGGWDDMSLPSGAQFTAWNKWKLGWLTPDRLQCVESGTVTATLRPLEAPDGLKAIVLPVDRRVAYVAEVREWIGADAVLCDEGLLVYKIDTALQSGESPMLIIGGARGVSDEGTRRCGAAYNATFGMQPGKTTLFEDPASGIAIELLQSSLGSYTVKASKGLASRGQSLVISRSSVIWSNAHPEPFTVAVDATESFKGALMVTVSRDAPWLKATLDNGTVPATLTIAADASQLRPGTYTGTIDISAPGAINSPRSITATLKLP